MLKPLTSDQEMNPVLNSMTVDFEDWFCTHNLSHRIRRDEWDQLELRIAKNTLSLLDLFSKHDIQATFFILGWLAEKVPDLIREIAFSSYSGFRRENPLTAGHMVQMVYGAQGRNTGCGFQS